MYGITDSLISFQSEKTKYYNKFMIKYKNKEEYDTKKAKTLEIWMDMYAKLHLMENSTLSESMYSKKPFLAEEELNAIEAKYKEAFEYPLPEGVYNNLLQGTFNKIKNFIATDKSITYNNEEEAEASILKFKYDTMKNLNPKFVMRRHVLQRGIKEAESDNFSLFNEQFDLLITPFNEHNNIEYKDRYTPDNNLCDGVKLSCSS
jgi:uncharacterized protein YdiU (UPF0061 family)